MERRLKLRVAFVDGDDLMPTVSTLLASGSASSGASIHLDGENRNIQFAKDTLSFLDDPDTMPVVSANAYLGYRAIRRGLDEGADIIICGRVADASPVIGAAAWWYGWAESDFNALAGALIAGHLIECSTYVTGANFAGAHQHSPDEFVDLGLPIAEVLANGECIITKHNSTGGFFTADTVTCQLLYELQGNIYLNSDVKADITSIRITDQGLNRVHVSGVKGHPPPPTTKLAVFYVGGYQLEILINATGYATEHKWNTQEAQFRSRLENLGTLNKLDFLEFQRIGMPEQNPTSQLAATTYMRVFAQAREQHIVASVTAAWFYHFMAHFPGMNCSLDFRTAVPKPFLGYLPAVVQQEQLHEAVTVLDEQNVQLQRRFEVGPPKITEPIAVRQNYETAKPCSLNSFGSRTLRPLGDIALARSGDKAGNVNIGFFVHTPEEFDWLRSFLTREKLKDLMREDWRDWYFIERVEMANIFAVHFVVYGVLGRGVSSSGRLDCLGKGFAEFLRAVWVPMPDRFMSMGSARL